MKLYHEKGFRPSKILKRLKELSISKDKFYRVCKRLRVGDLVDNRYRSGRGRTARTAQAIRKIRAKIRKNPRQ